MGMGDNSSEEWALLLISLFPVLGGEGKLPPPRELDGDVRGMTAVPAYEECEEGGTAEEPRVRDLFVGEMLEDG